MGLDSGSSPTASPSRESVTISSSPLAVYTFRAASAFSISTPPAGISSSTALIMPASPWLTASSSAWVGLTTAVISHWDRSTSRPSLEVTENASTDRIICSAPDFGTEAAIS